MNPEETPSSILREHLEICSELHSLLLEESQLLRSTGSPPDEKFLERKRIFLPRLDNSLGKMRHLNDQNTGFSKQESALVEEGRKRLLQIMMLDRENERLLLQASLPAHVKEAYAPVAPGRVARAYGQFSGTKTRGSA
jgi:hypothetical protein